MDNTLTGWLERQGIVHQGDIYLNLDPSQLITKAIQKNEGELTIDGALGVITKPYTGRSPDDKYIVDYEDRTDLWWGNVNRKMSPKVFNRLHNRISAYLSNRDLYIIDAFIGADPKYQLSIRIVCEFAWQALAAENLFIFTGKPLETDPDITILAAPDFYTNPEIDMVKSKAAISIDLKKEDRSHCSIKIFWRD